MQLLCPWRCNLGEMMSVYMHVVFLNLKSTQTNRNCMPIYSDVHNYAEMQLFFLRPRYELSTKSVVQPNVRTTAPSTSSRNIPRTAQRFHVMLTDLDSTR
ncbi:hypothetical protein AcW1_009379 [Taiwanofungus camphoratus]|nr:hypothetical protein AcW1_009379 [Antrodia cinnamomea]